MSKENVQGFYGFVKDNKELNKELSEAAVTGNIVVLAKEKGFEFTQAEHDEFIMEMAAGVSKLSDDQLEEVAGGNSTSILQICVTCMICGWDTGWIDLNGASDTIRTLMAEHKKKTQGLHDDFMKKYKSRV